MLDSDLTLSVHEFRWLGDNQSQRWAACYTSHMPDEARPVATSPDTQYSLTIDEAATLYARAGHPRTLRTVQRYCASGHLECVKAQTMLGDKYFVEPTSVARHIAQIEELVGLNTRAQGPGFSRQVATPVAAQYQNADDPQDATEPDLSPPVAIVAKDSEPELAQAKIETGAETNVRHAPTPVEPASRQDATDEAMTSRYVAQLEKRIEEKDQVITLITTQLTAKDQQISELSTRYRETHTLLGAMQRMLAPLLGQQDPYQAAPPNRDVNPVSEQSH